VVPVETEDAKQSLGLTIQDESALWGRRGWTTSTHSIADSISDRPTNISMTTRVEQDRCFSTAAMATRAPGTAHETAGKILGELKADHLPDWTHCLTKLISNSGERSTNGSVPAEQNSKRLIALKYPKWLSNRFSCCCVRCHYNNICCCLFICSSVRAKLMDFIT